MAAVGTRPRTTEGRHIRDAISGRTIIFYNIYYLLTICFSFDVELQENQHIEFAENFTELWNMKTFALCECPQINP